MVVKAVKTQDRRPFFRRNRRMATATAIPTATAATAPLKQQRKCEQNQHHETPKKQGFGVANNSSPDNTVSTQQDENEEELLLTQQQQQGDRCLGISPPTYHQQRAASCSSASSNHTEEPPMSMSVGVHAANKQLQQQPLSPIIQHPLLAVGSREWKEADPAHIQSADLSTTLSPARRIMYYNQQQQHSSASSLSSPPASTAAAASSIPQRRGIHWKNLNNMTPTRQTASSLRSIKQQKQKAPSASSKALPNYKNHHIKIFLLITDPKSRLFELIQLEYPRYKTTIGKLIQMIPKQVTEPQLQKLQYIGLTRPKRHSQPMMTLDVLASSCPNCTSPLEDRPSHTNSATTTTTARIVPGEILCAIPNQHSAKEIVRLSKQILANAHIQKLLAQSCRHRTSCSSKPQRSTTSDNNNKGGGPQRKKLPSTSRPLCHHTNNDTSAATRPSQSNTTMSLPCHLPADPVLQPPQLGNNKHTGYNDQQAHGQPLPPQHTGDQIHSSQQKLSHLEPLEEQPSSPCSGGRLYGRHCSEKEVQPHVSRYSRDGGDDDEAVQTPIQKFPQGGKQKIRPQEVACLKDPTSNQATVQENNEEEKSLTTATPLMVDFPKGMLDEYLSKEDVLRVMYRPAVIDDTATSASLTSLQSWTPSLDSTASTTLVGRSRSSVTARSSSSSLSAVEVAESRHVLKKRLARFKAALSQWLSLLFLLSIVRYTFRPPDDGRAWMVEQPMGCGGAFHCLLTLVILIKLQLLLTSPVIKCPFCLLFLQMMSSDQSNNLEDSNRCMQA